MLAELFQHSDGRDGYRSVGPSDRSLHWETGMALPTKIVEFWKTTFFGWSQQNFGCVNKMLGSKIVAFGLRNQTFGCVNRKK